MPYLKLSLGRVNAFDFASLMWALRLYGVPYSPVVDFIIPKPLTPAQLRRVPKGLRAQIKVEVPTE